MRGAWWAIMTCFGCCAAGEEWFDEGSPARVRALVELRASFRALQNDVRLQDEKCRRLYRRFYTHTAAGGDPEVEYFVGALAWYKQNRDEMHGIMSGILVMFANAQTNEETFPIEWEPLPEKIRAARRKWSQPYTHECIAERNVVESFSMPVVRRGAVLDDETDVEYAPSKQSLRGKGGEHNS